MASRRTNGSTFPHKARALRLIERGDLDGYSALFAKVTADADRNARHVAQRELVQAAIEAGLVVPPAQAQRVWSTGARETLALLERDPREPMLLNQCGVLLYQLSGFGAAQALFEAAQRLDPALPNVADNIARVVSRRRVADRASAAVRGELAPRAEAVAAAAQPAEGMTVSLCMIVKDEEEMLPRCLAAAAPAVDEIVVVDTGSGDRTVEIAESFGARVIHFPWTGSFSEARNVGLDAATSDWLLVLDADEVLVADDVTELRALLGRTWREAFYLSEINYTGELDDGAATTHSTLRLFRARPEYRYSGRLHEQILDTMPIHLPERIVSAPVRIEHFGYLGAVRDAKEKSRRNLELLERQLEEGDDSAFMHFNIGSEYYALDDVPRALAEYERAAELFALEDDGRVLGYLPALVSRHVATLRASGSLEQAIALADRWLERMPSFTDLVFDQATALRALGRLDEAAARYERCIEMGDAPSGYTATVGCGTFHPTIALAELKLQRGDVAAAIGLLGPCLERHPGFYGLVLPFANALLADGAAPETVVTEVERRVADLTPTVRFMLGTALYEHGDIAAAETQYRQLLERQPSSGRGHIALAEALLSQSRWEEAAATAAALDDSDPLAPTARRSELFARIAGGDLDGAAAVLARDDAARAAGEPDEPGLLLPGDRELFGGWLAAARGERDDAVLPLVAVPALSVTLEALLRVEEVDAFGTLVPLLDRTPIAPREQRELRARMYLRRGFLASAAEEWLAICSVEPDVRALIGLAQVAVAQGMAEEALDFAREACAIDPDDADAARVLARLAPLAA